jgi:hypothetical protein
MEVLNALIHEADHREIFSPLPDKIKHNASVYADVLVIFLSSSVQDFTNIRCFWTSSRAPQGLSPTLTSASSH